MFVRRALLVAVAVAVVALAAVGAGLAVAAREAAPAVARPAGDPVAFLRTLVDQVVNDDYAAAWKTLHPVHQRAAARPEYVECEQLTPIPGRLEAFEVRGTRDEQLTVPGVSGPVAGKSIALRIVLVEPALRHRVAILHTFHVVAVGGRWAWILPEARYESYLADVCPGAPGPRS